MRALTVLSLAIAAMPLDAQFGMPPKQRSEPSRGDLPAIKCGVCEGLAEHLHEKVSEMRESAPFGKVHEDDISAVLEEACDPSKKTGRWITQYDIVEENGFLELRKPGGMSHCREECETIAKSCSALVEDELDAEEFVVALWRNKLGLEELRKQACGEWSGRCGKKRVKAPEDREDFYFQEKSEKDFELEDMMETLQGMGGGMGGMGGPGMQAYTPDDLAAMEEMMGGMGGMDDMMGGMGGDPYGDFDMGGGGGLGEF
eukprot:jgi/Undpi1/6541/HiC_scaffold_20.g09020.m1